MLRYDIAGKKRGAQMHYVALLVLLILVAGLRYRVGGDTLNYILWYESFPDIHNIDWTFAIKFQPLCLLYFSLCKTISEDFTFLQIVSAIFVNTTFFWFFKKYTKYYFTAAFIFCIMLFLRMNMEAIRESFAVSFFLIALKYAETNKWIKYFIFATISFLFHVSAVIIFIYPFIANRNNSKFAIFAIFAVVGGLLLGSIFLNSDLAQFYTDTYEDQKRTFFGYIGNVFSIVILIPFWVLLGKRLGIMKPLYRNYFYMFGIIQVTMFFSSIGYRFNNYFLAIFILFLSDLLTELVKKKHCIKNAPLLYLALLIFVLWPYVSTYWDTFPNTKYKRYHVIYPYYSVFNKHEDTIRENIEF